MTPRYFIPRSRPAPGAVELDLTAAVLVCELIDDDGLTHWAEFAPSTDRVVKGWRARKRTGTRSNIHDPKITLPFVRKGGSHGTKD